MDQRIRILVIVYQDDDREKLQYLLEEKEYTVDQALCRAEALKKIGQKAFDLVLAEIPVPDMDGVEMLRHIREVNPTTSLVVMGGDIALEAAIETWRCDISGYVSRPFDDPDEVLAAVTCGLTDHSKMRASKISGIPVMVDDEKGHEV